MNQLIIILILLVHYIAEAQTNPKPPELCLSIGGNYGTKSDFNNTSNLKVFTKPSFCFEISGRWYHKKLPIILDAGAGLSSIRPILYVDKNNFSSNNEEAHDVYTFLPAIYEFFHLQTTLATKQKLFHTKKLDFSVVIGIGAKYMPLIYLLDWSTYDEIGTEYTYYELLFDKKYSTGSYLNAQRRVILNSYAGLNITPKKMLLKGLTAELYWQPAITYGISTAYTIIVPNAEYKGTQQFNTSTYGIKLMHHVPYKKK